MELRVRYFDFCKRVIEKTEKIQSFLGYLTTRLLPFSKNKAYHAWASHPSSNVSKRKATLLQDRQAKSMSALTIISAIFLPLSLAATLLSMQYRYADIKSRLFDFCGIAGFFFTFAGILYSFAQYLFGLSFRQCYFEIQMWNEDIKTDGIKTLGWMQFLLIPGWLCFVAFFMSANELLRAVQSDQRAYWLNVKKDAYLPPPASTTSTETDAVAECA
ncbi:hypothetical protein K458DRAFT_381961 [Lentithecium fluviatile CBS 122367]|uniref:Uncharacterized protein n=1 Tax=Lentithecium fluviatile CBS 122367 TaxID=1168545 RepID=A0A6G1JPU2_9PLEO|nr:hypothetical protein K458DRAFT_381961 [Lentithecium fluviatile CBS 122367]